MTLKAQYILVQNIRAFLATRNLAAEELAQYCGHGAPWISKILNGDRGVRCEDLDRIADFFEVEVTTLFRHGNIAPLLDRRRYDRRSQRGDRRIMERRKLQEPLPPHRLPHLLSAKLK